MFGLLFKCLQTFGFKGIVIYLQLKFNATESISLPGIKHPIRMRPTNTDKITFKEIFIKKEYDISVPASIDVKFIIDAGANIGFTSVFLANRYPSAQIISIEPDDENFTYLQENVKHYPNITPLKSALWHQKDKINIVDKGYGKRGLMIEKNEGSHVLHATSINDLLVEYKFHSLDILKMDIEGSEKEVFSENYEWLSNTKCLVIELHDRMKPGCSRAVFHALNQHQFSVSMRGENLIFIQEKYL
jgi:FkbM family methyltransferase